MLLLLFPHPEAVFAQELAKGLTEVQLPASGEEQLSGISHALIDLRHEQEYHPFGRLCRLGPQGFWIKFAGKFLTRSLCQMVVC